ncbi:nitrate reductase molybdenum cofactor assembly chaperone [Nocardia huaxiensis]|uniref:Nitrate reductase molybdenum cofactor assembly chaperone n=1 Tax=Nocardia huaxiensis TaxID=2755382 RepID=A0A7D6ZEQ1_9NOCA|nr:nitrate reductase molybdenum cofactor assembly chaperone [Nocardia huaxiensis]QLY28447.1 nitrate reductase molybdenum cofactor assembly chaperone [Nocardia huaxiensis]UFS98103.1 nitrate reductase molybdenum cofactor assembly chaperone [Nocardia huaxiensis]
MKLTDTQRSTAWQVQSLLLSYPDADLLGWLPLLRRSAAALPDALGAPLQPLLIHLETGEPLALATEFVDTFDHRKRFSPYLTWFAHGDTRKRGMALLRFKQVYRDHGLLLDEGELPDHLAVVLEFASAHPGPGQRLLIEHRAGLEVMRLALREAGSAWTGVLESVSATLPPLRGDEQAAIAKLVAAGPPDEGVGLEPFAPPTYMPADLGMPTVAGGRR